MLRQDNFWRVRCVGLTGSAEAVSRRIRRKARQKWQALRPTESGESRKGYGLGEMLLDMSGGLASLPGGEATVSSSFGEASCGTDSYQLMCQHDPQGSEVTSRCPEPRFSINATSFNAVSINAPSSKNSLRGSDSLEEPIGG